jgi:protein-S-isoprenylcysteine O-methyltransferase Ste14
VANGLAAANWFIFATALAALSFIVLRTPKEEARLIERFGDAYRTYMAQTGAFFPKF